MASLDSITTIIILMMENRSFDHMLGYLSLPPSNRTDIEGQSTDPAWLQRFTNFDTGQAVQPFLSSDPHTMPGSFDPPHERPNVAAQIDPRQDGAYPMNGFVSSIPPKVSSDADVRRLVMSYFGARQAPMNDFFAKCFSVCDRWFSSLPAGTQPNRLMAMSGCSMIDINRTILPDQELVYHWLNVRGINWRVYHQELPFFTLMPKWIPSILFDDEHFRSFKDFGPDLLNTPPDKRPQVIFVEPTYEDAPHTGFSTDDHAPAGISDGQDFLLQVYNAVITPGFWSGALMIVTYDEHGGFFDHVSPPPVPTRPPDGAAWSTPFASLGVRVPAYIISPFVRPGTVNHNLLDHTSVLKLLGEKFGSGSYCPAVDARPVGSISHLLDFTDPQSTAPAAPPLDSYLSARPAPPTGVIVPPSNTALRQGFHRALEDMKQHGANEAHPKFGHLFQ